MLIVYQSQDEIRCLVIISGVETGQGQIIPRLTCPPTVFTKLLITTNKQCKWRNSLDLTRTYPKQK